MHLEQISSQITPGTTLNAFFGAGKLHLAPSPKRQMTKTDSKNRKEKMKFVEAVCHIPIP
jgi:hypothetical protein